MTLRPSMRLSPVGGYVKRKDRVGVPVQQAAGEAAELKQPHLERATGKKRESEHTGRSTI